MFKVRSGNPPQQERLLLRLDSQGPREGEGRVGAALPGPRATTGGLPSPGAAQACRISPGPGEPPYSSLQTTWTAGIKEPKDG